MIVIVVFVVVGASVLLIGLLIVGSQRCWRYCDWGYKGSAQQGRIPEAGHNLSPAGRWSNRRAKHLSRQWRAQRTEYKDDWCR
jgi:hypothetical protein